MKNKNYLVFLCVLCYMGFNCIGQNYEDFKNAESVNEKITIAEKLSTEYLEVNLDSLRILGYELLSYSNTKRSELGINYSKKYLGCYLTRTANELKGLELLRNAKNYFIEVQDYTNVSEICFEIGNGYHYNKKYNEAIKWDKESLKYGALSPDPEMKKAALINMAQAYLELKKYEIANEKALEYRDWVLSLGKYQSVSNSYAVLGKIALAQEEYDKAVSYFEINEKFASKSGSKSQRAHANTNIGISKFYLGLTDECLSYFQKALELRLEIKNIQNICDGYLNLGGMYFELGELEEAEENYIEGLNLASKHEKYSHEMEFIVALIELKKLQKTPIDELENQYESAKEKHMNRLTEKNAVDIKLEKELNESMAKEKDTKSKSKVPFYIGAFVIFFVFILLAFRKKSI